MIFKGNIYKKCPRVTVSAIINNHIRFARVVKGEYVDIPCKGHSLTNLMYATDGYMYLALNGEVYRRPYCENHPAIYQSAPVVSTAKLVIEHDEEGDSYSIIKDGVTTHIGSFNCEDHGFNSVQDAARALLAMAETLGLTVDRKSCE